MFCRLAHRDEKSDRIYLLSQVPMGMGVMELTEYKNSGMIGHKTNHQLHGAG